MEQFSIFKTLVESKENPYGFCPQCGAKGVMTERRIDGDSTCANGHKLPRSKFLSEQVSVDGAKRFRTTVKHDLKLKSGLTIPKGAKVECEFNESMRTIFLVHYEDKTFKLKYGSASAYLTGFNKEPSMLKLEKYVNDGIATTPLGTRTEPDGYGEYGEPSWLLILGLI